MQYNRTGGCRSYYSCEYGVSVPMCCEIGSRYDGTMCVQDHTCYEPCSTPYDIETQLNRQCKFELANLIAYMIFFLLQVISEFFRYIECSLIMHPLQNIRSSTHP